MSCGCVINVMWMSHQCHVDASSMSRTNLSTSTVLSSSVAGDVEDEDVVPALAPEDVASATGSKWLQNAFPKQTQRPPPPCSTGNDGWTSMFPPPPEPVIELIEWTVPSTLCLAFRPTKSWLESECCPHFKKGFGKKGSFAESALSNVADIKAEPAFFCTTRANLVADSSFL